MNYQGGYGGGGGGNSGQQQYGGEGMGMGSGGGTNSHYDPSEVLSDAIATVSFSRFCRVSGKSIVSIVGKVAIVE